MNLKEIDMSIVKTLAVNNTNMEIPEVFNDILAKSELEAVLIEELEKLLIREAELRAEIADVFTEEDMLNIRKYNTTLYAMDNFRKCKTMTFQESYDYIECLNDKQDELEAKEEAERIDGKY